MSVNLTALCAGLLAACAAGAATAAAAYPEKPLRMIAPFATGGNTDITARLVAQGLSERLGRPVVVENRGGAGGRIGTALAAQAAPDGYTLLLGSNGPLAINPGFISNLPYDPLRDFAYTSLVSSVALVLSAHPSVPARSVRELITLAKSRPGQLTMGSAGVGSNTHLTGELFQMVTATKFVHVPFKGSGQALIDLLGGQVDFMFDQLSSSLPMIKGGKLRALGMATMQRSPMLPEVPTINESGVRDFEGSTYTGVMLPAATPREIVMTIYDALTQWLDQPSTRESFAKLGTEVIKSTPEEAAQRIRNDIIKWTKVRIATNIKLD